jgi:hypothetical protein
LAVIFFIAFLINLIGNYFIKEEGIIMAAFSFLISNVVILLLQIIYIFLEKNKREKDLC